MGYFRGLGIGLSFVLGCILMGLVAGLYYLLWWKRKISHNSTSSSSSSSSSPQIGDPEGGHQGPKDFGEDGIEAELMRAHNLHGPPRFLFTIKEESKEDLEWEDGKSRSSLNELLLSSPTAKGSWYPYGNPLFEWLTEADLRSSPPPKFKFLKDAEDKLLRKVLAEQNPWPKL